MFFENPKPQHQKIKYGLRYCGARNAEMYADAAIAKVYECLLARTYAITSPVASMTWWVRHYVARARKHRIDNKL